MKKSWIALCTYALTKPGYNSSVYARIKKSLEHHKKTIIF